MSLNLSSIKKITTRSGTNITKVRRRSDMKILWSAEEYIYQNGVLASGVTLKNFSNTGAVLSAGTNADSDEENQVEAKIYGIDMTNYSKLEMIVEWYVSCVYGDVWAKYGIDDYVNRIDNGVKETQTITLDISGYSGTHSLNFLFYAKNDSSYYGADSTAKISSIKLYN